MSENALAFHESLIGFKVLSKLEKNKASFRQRK